MSGPTSSSASPARPRPTWPSSSSSWADAGLDAIGIFGYSDEDGTEAASLPGKLDDAEIARRVEEFADLAEELMAQRAADRLGETLDVLIEEPVPRRGT